MDRLRLLALAWALAGGFAGCAGCGEDPVPPGADGGGDGADAGDDGGVMTQCVPLGDPCGTGDVCCVGACGPQGVCEKLTVQCGESGAACQNGTDCCTNRCDNGTCSGSQCLDNGDSCGGNSECCTANCAGGTCAAIPGSGACSVEGQACTSGTQCCSTNCQGGVCAPAFSCRASNDLCFGDEDCCSKRCSKNDGSAGYCVEPSGGCNQDGLPCAGSSTCCTRVCADPGTGATVCLPASGCKMTGAPCLNDDQCCGGGVNPNGTVVCIKANANDTYGRCNNGQSCNGVGNICGASFPTPDGGTFSVNADQNCCNGKKAVCKLDSSGIPRCFGGGTTTCPDGYTGEPGCCIELGEICQFKDQCCSGAPCVPDDQGVLRCTASTCTPLGEACTPQDGGTECCAGECQAGEIGSTCQIPSNQPDAGVCKSNGSACTDPSECCSTVCDMGECKVPDACQGQGEVCTSSADCCTGTSCVIPSGSTSGVCQPSTCGNAGQACSPTNPCCEGNQCLKDGAITPCDGTTACTCKVVIIG